jgi:hypothetical protein
MMYFHVGLLCVIQWSHCFWLICKASIAFLHGNQLFNDKQVKWTEVIHFLHYIVCQHCTHISVYYTFYCLQLYRCPASDLWIKLFLARKQRWTRSRFVPQKNRLWSPRNETRDGMAEKGLRGRSCMWYSSAHSCIYYYNGLWLYKIYINRRHTRL